MAKDIDKQITRQLRRAALDQIQRQERRKELRAKQGRWPLQQRSQR